MKRVSAVLASALFAHTAYPQTPQKLATYRGEDRQQCLPQLPEVPTVTESGLPEFEGTLAYGIPRAPGTPKAVLEEIRAQIARVAATREYRERIELEGAVPLDGTSVEFAALIRAQAEKWGKLTRASGIKHD